MPVPEATPYRPEVFPAAVRHTGPVTEVLEKISPDSAVAELRLPADLRSLRTWGALVVSCVRTPSDAFTFAGELPLTATLAVGADGPELALRYSNRANSLVIFFDATAQINQVKWFNPQKPDSVTTPEVYSAQSSYGIAEGLRYLQLREIIVKRMAEAAGINAPSLEGLRPKELKGTVPHFLREDYEARIWLVTVLIDSRSEFLHDRPFVPKNLATHPRDPRQDPMTFVKTATRWHAESGEQPGATLILSNGNNAIRLNISEHGGLLSAAYIINGVRHPPDYVMNLAPLSSVTTFESLAQRAIERVCKDPQLIELMS